ncbi:hypothetical protein BCR37DRAFT_379306 [Protomyces lactucae-debilis]|uniref:Uncharacterized protein n=1 Tax=Protomyces lactucae-debilis TaxID=2754530 RepID=A0A1Y2FKF9_PROLT|nr:uncharacterized protein BCR37DRAFT_379306 [Protomyces lactucae-debilis]ORY83275.1 hypothetical protein BCR37DRAFT_379306 [Protomyces lactucae-debilis]
MLCLVGPRTIALQMRRLTNLSLDASHRERLPRYQSSRIRKQREGTKRRTRREGTLCNACVIFSHLSYIHFFFVVL